MKRSVRATIAVGLLSAVFLAAPSAASAQIVQMAQTTQVLPPGGQNCSTLSVSEVRPYIYDNELHSFDIVVRDPSYVALLASAGEKTLPFNYMTRFQDAQGVRYHVDMDPMSVARDVPITMTLLSSLSGRPTCLSVVAAVIPGTGVSPIGTTPGGGIYSPTTDDGGSVSKPIKPVATSSTTTVVGPTKAEPSKGTFSGICASNGALQLWFLLLAIYIVIVALTALAQPPLSQKHPGIPLAAILVPLVLLIAFWYFAPLCRAAAWIPTLALFVAIAGLLAAFREQNPSVKVIPLPAARQPSRNTPAITQKGDEKPKK